MEKFEVMMGQDMLDWMWMLLGWGAKGWGCFRNPLSYVSGSGVYANMTEGIGSVLLGGKMIGLIWNLGGLEAIPEAVGYTHAHRAQERGLG